MSATVDRLTSTLQAEYAACYAYGLIGSHVSGTARTRAARALDSHQQARDQLRVSLTALNADIPSPAPAYQPPTPVTNSPSAIALAVNVEQNLIRQWAAVSAVSGGNSRDNAIQNAQECAVRAIAWGASSQAFPG